MQTLFEVSNFSYFVMRLWCAGRGSLSTSLRVRGYSQKVAFALQILKFFCVCWFPQMKNKKLTDEFFKKYENYEKETTEDFIKKHSSTEDALIEGNNRLTYIQHGEMIRDIELDRLEKESEELIETLHDIDREQPVGALTLCGS